METAADKGRAFTYALAVHLACLGLLLGGLWWTQHTQTVSIPGPVIEATLVGPAQAPRAARSKPKPVPPKPETPKPETPKPEEKVESNEPPKPDTREQERVAALAAQQAEQEKREQEERRRQQQTLLEEQQKQAAEKKRKLEEEKQKQMQDRQAKERADKERKLEQQRMAELMEAEQARTGGEGQDDSLLAQYVAAMKNTVKWTRPESTQPFVCELNIKQIPGGEVLSANVVEPCRADALTKRAIEAAALQAQPLPYKGFESVFRREIIITFCHPEELCSK